MNRSPYGLVALVALLVVGALGVGRAVAAVHIESCMEGGKECKTASVGTTFEATSKEFTLEAEGKIQDKCELTSVNEVTDSTSEKAGDQIKYVTTKATFSNCTTSAVTAKELPWSWVSDMPTFEETHAGERFAYAVENRFCTYGTEAPNHLVFEVWNNNNQPVDTGALKYVLGLSCYSLINVGNPLTVGTVNDPNLAKATTIAIK